MEIPGDNAGSSLFDELWRACNGVLKSAIDAHGPITKDNYGSAGKRLAGQLLSIVERRMAKSDAERREME